MVDVLVFKLFGMLLLIILSEVVIFDSAIVELCATGKSEVADVISTPESSTEELVVCSRKQFLLLSSI